MSNPLNEAEQSNQALWDELAPVHVQAYDEVGILRAGGIVLDDTELQALGDVRGKTLLHLQCHIGTDTLSWARLGALVTGVDFSRESLAQAQQLQRELGLAATWVHSNVYDLPTVLDAQFDIVYTSRGVLCWLRDLDAWGRIVAHFLRPGGTFFIQELHPILNALDESPPSRLEFLRPYFHRIAPTKWESEGDYADESYVSAHASYEWDWSLADILNALCQAGLVIDSFQEYDRLFFKCFPSMVNCSSRWYVMPGYEGKLPLMFNLRAHKP